MWIAGVTGTNGKTSVSQWIAQVLEVLDERCGIVGTLGNGLPGHLVESVNTPPDAITLQAALASLVTAGASSCAMEVSSIGLDQRRVAGVDFDVAIFTNLTRDHLDYHGDMARYALAKEMLFQMPDNSFTIKVKIAGPVDFLFGFRIFFNIVYCFFVVFEEVVFV